MVRCEAIQEQQFGQKKGKSSPGEGWEVGRTVLDSYRGPGSGSPGCRTGEPVAGLLGLWPVVATEPAVNRALLLPAVGLLLAAHPAPPPPGLTTRGAAGLPVPGHPAEGPKHKDVKTSLLLPVWSDCGMLPR